jgi:hypothetical protein
MDLCKEARIERIYEPSDGPVLDTSYAYAANITMSRTCIETLIADLKRRGRLECVAKSCSGVVEKWRIILIDEGEMVYVQFSD